MTTNHDNNFKMPILERIMISGLDGTSITPVNRKNLDQVLGLHLHDKTDQNAFYDTIKFGILDVVNPTKIDKKEYIWRHRLNTFQPVGRINTEYLLEFLIWDKPDVIL